MHSIRFYHWLVVLALALMLHAVFLWAYPNEEDKGLAEATQEIGVVAFEIGLATETIKQSEPPPEPKAKPVEPKLVEKKAPEPPPSVPEPDPTPVIEPEVEVDVAIAPIEEPVVEHKVEVKPQEIPKSEPEPVEFVEEVVKTEPPKIEPVNEHIAEESTDVDQAVDESPHEARESAVAGGSKGMEDDYQAQLSAWLEKHKTYPRRAKQRRQEGTAFLRFKIDRQGKLISHEIETSSGFRLLDTAVERMLMRSLPLPEMPLAMGKTEMEFILPVSFQLR